MQYKRRMPKFAVNKQSKYHNTKVEYDGELFDSKKEAIRYAELKLLEKAGKITELERQKRFLLIPALRDTPTEKYKKGPQKGEFKPGKVIERPTYYIADFVYTENGKQVVEDTKGFKTKDYILKRKLMLWVHGIRVKEV